MRPPPGGRMRGRKRERLGQWAFIAPAIIFVALFFAYPVAKSLIMGSQDYTVQTFFTGQAPWVGIQNYVDVVAGTLFATSLTNTLLFAAGAIAGHFVIGLALAVFFNRRFPFNTLIRSLMLIPWLVPLVASAAVWKWMFAEGGVLNQSLKFLQIIHAPIPWLSSPSVALISVIIVGIWVGLPLNIALFYSGLQGIPTEIYEAGELDGATRWKAFRYLTWPLLRPVVSVVLVLGLVYTLKALDIILALTGGGPANSTQTLATYSYNESFVQFSFGTGAAISNILILISLLFTIIYIRADRKPTDV